MLDVVQEAHRKYFNEFFYHGDSEARRNHGRYPIVKPNFSDFSR